MENEYSPVSLGVILLRRWVRKPRKLETTRCGELGPLPMEKLRNLENRAAESAPAPALAPPVTPTPTPAPATALLLLLPAALLLFPSWDATFTFVQVNLHESKANWPKRSTAFALSYVKAHTHTQAGTLAHSRTHSTHTDRVCPHRIAYTV